MNTPNNTHNVCDEDEISLKDVIHFFAISWKSILSFSLVGLVIALIFIFTATPRYEGIAQVQMSQLAPKGSGNSSSPNIEDPALLIERFKLPSTYTVEEVNACGLQGSDFFWGYEDPREKLAKSVVKMYHPKGLNIVEIKTKSKTVAIAQSCINALVDRVRVTQNEIKAPFLQEARQKITIYQKQLEVSKNIIARADNSSGTLTVSYLVAREEIKFLQDAIMNLENFIASGETGKAKLVSPIYVSNEPIFPKKILSIFVGLMVGLFTGILFMVSQLYLRSQP